MEKFNRLAICLLLSGVFVLTGCVYKVKQNSNEKLPPDSEIGKFDFATTVDVNLSVNYGITYPLLFEVYLKDPMLVKEGSEVKNENMKPVFKAITDDSGVFDGEVLLPTYAKEVYLYTQYMGVPTSVNLKIEGGGVRFDLTENQVLRTKSNSLARIGQVNGNFKVIDTWNEQGRPDHMLPRRVLEGELINNIMYTLPESKNGIGATNDPNNLIKEGDAIGDIHILKSTKINLLFMHEGASMRSTLAYYCYPTDTPPQTTDDLTRVIAIPNFSYAYSGGELSSGDCVQLKYWNGTEFVEEFPAGMTIGWCMIANGFQIQSGDINTKDNVYYANPVFNPERVKKQHCVALYDKNKKVIALGFEDQNRERLYNGALVSDEDFNDLVFYVETSVDGGVDSGGIPEIIPNPTPKPDPADNYIEYSGSLAFEDLWPSQGDYDMNDVVIDYHSTHYRNAKNQIIQIVDKFTPKWSGAALHNGFGYQLGISSSVIRSVKVESDFDNQLSFFKTDGKGLELNQNLPTIMLFEDIKKILPQNGTSSNNTKSFTVTVEFNFPISIGNLTSPPYNPFIVSNSGDGANPQRGVEVHLPNKKPTNLADKSKLGTASDISDIENGRFYISNENYMFALDLPVTFNFPAEGQRIGSAYSRFSSWVLSGGMTDADWYLDEKK